MFNATVLATIIASMAVIAVRLALVRRVRPELPMNMLFAGDRSLPLWNDAVDEAHRRTDKVTVMLLRSYRVTRAVAVVLFIVVCGMVLLKNTN